MLIRPNDPRLTWQGIVSLQKKDGWVKPWRIQHDQIGLFPEDILLHAAEPAGGRISFQTDATSLAGHIVPEGELGLLDLRCDGALIGTVDLTETPRFQFNNLPSGMKLVELWLPAYGPIRVHSLELPDESALAPFSDTRPRWLAYGSSITQSGAAKSPSHTWPSIVARERGLNLTCLGYCGQCHLDPIMARMIRDLKADFISICAGINIYGQNTFSPVTFQQALIGFVLTIRDKHPGTPMVVTSPIYCAPRETTSNAVGLNLIMMREEIASAVDKLKSHGDNNLHYVNGLNIFGPDLSQYMPDQVHPNSEGYKLLARNYLDTVIAQVFP